jgi:hypothetical protein
LDSRARNLAFLHPATGNRMEIEAPLPADMLGTLDALRQWRKL